MNTNLSLYRIANYVSSFTGSVGFAAEMVFAFNKGSGAAGLAAFSLIRTIPNLIAPSLSPFIGRLIRKKTAMYLSSAISIFTKLIVADLAFTGRLNLPHLFLLIGINSFIGSVLSPLSRAYTYDLVEKDHADLPTIGRTALTTGKALAFSLVIAIPMFYPQLQIADGTGFVFVSTLIEAVGQIISLALMAMTRPVRSDTSLKPTTLSFLAQSMLHLKEMFGSNTRRFFWFFTFSWNIWSIQIMYRPGFLKEQFNIGPAGYLDFSLVSVAVTAAFLHYFSRKSAEERQKLTSQRFFSSLVIVQYCWMLVSVLAPTPYLAVLTVAICAALWELVALSTDVWRQDLAGPKWQSEYQSMYQFLQQLAFTIALFLSFCADKYGYKTMLLINGTIGLVLAITMRSVFRKEH